MHLLESRQTALWARVATVGAQCPQVLHDPPLQEPHELPLDEDAKVDPLLNPKDESSLSTCSLSQSGHFTFAQQPITSSSNLRPHCLHLYSNMGMTILSLLYHIRPSNDSIIWALVAACPAWQLLKNTKTCSVLCARLRILGIHSFSSSCVYR